MFISLIIALKTLKPKLFTFSFYRTTKKLKLLRTLKVPKKLKLEIFRDFGEINQKNQRQKIGCKKLELFVFD